MSSHELEDELIQAAQGGDRMALGQLLVRHADALARRLAARLPRSLGRVTSVDDILQQTYADAFRDMGQFQPRGEGSFLAWLDTIAQRRLQNMIKSASRLKRGGDRGQFDPSPMADVSVRDLLVQVSAREATASHDAVQREAANLLNIAMAELPDDYREVLRLRYFEGLSNEEAAAQMGRTAAGVRALVDRAKQRLRNVMGSLSSEA